MKKFFASILAIGLLICDPALAATLKIHVDERDIEIKIPAGSYKVIKLDEIILTATIPSQDIKITIPDPVVTLPPVVITPPPTPVPPPVPVPTPAAFSLYAPNSVWNKKLTNEPIDANSANLTVEMLNNQKIAGTWIETGPFATPIYFVRGNSIPKVKVFINGDNVSPNAVELAKGVPIPVAALPATGTDGHLCIIDTDNDKEYDFWQAKKQADGSFSVTNAGILPNVSTSDGTMELRTNGWNSATATHLPLAGGTILLKELQAGVIPHAIATAINRPKKHPAVVYPAKTTDGWFDNVNAIPEGKRFRFPANISINPNWTPITKMLVVAIRDHGLVVKDKTGAGVGFGVEDMRQYGITDTGAELKKYMGINSSTGKPNNIWDVLGTGKEFPWDQLQAVA